MKVAIVGGGTAGWMTAATLIRQFPQADLTLYESDKVPPIGVGESTTQFFRVWLKFLGLKDEEWMAACDATYKVSVMFHGFHDVDDSPWQYPFGIPRADTYTPDYWFYKQSQEGFPGSRLAEDYNLAAQCAIRNKLPVGEYANEYYDLQKSAGFHFNASKFAIWLRDNYCLPKGVKHVIKDIKKKPKADLVFDCTGFRSKFNKSKWISFEDYLPNNSAWVTRVHYDDKDTQIKPCTDCTALSSGWVWNVPTYETIGTGYVFCDKFISPENARKEFRKHLAKNVQSDAALYTDKMFRLIKFKTGRREEIWKGNVVSIGLSAGFIEPLESNGLLSVHNFLLNFIRCYRGKVVTQFTRDTFNNHCNHTFDSFASFVAMHYALTQRNDSPYWKHIQNIKYPYDSAVQAAQILHMESSSNFHKKLSYENFSNEGLFYVIAGHNWNPFTSPIEHEMRLFSDMPDIPEDIQWNEEEFDKMPLPMDYYKEKIYAS